MSEETEEKKLSPELLAELQKVKGLTTTHEFLYVPKVYRKAGVDVIPKSEWPIFKLKGKDGVEIAEAEDKAGYVDSSTTNIHLTVGTQRIETLKKHILGWKNFKDRDGNEIPCVIKAGEVYKTNLARIPVELQKELHEAINEQSVLTQEELEGLEF